MSPPPPPPPRAGAPTPLLSSVSLDLPPNQLGLIFGRSGAGKTTLLQLVAGLAQQCGGAISFSGPPPPVASTVSSGNGSSSRAAAASAADEGLSSEERMAQAGLVFQFPERHFIGRSLSAELTVGWPIAPEQLMLRTALAQRTHEVGGWEQGGRRCGGRRHGRHGRRGRHGKGAHGC